MAFAYLYFCVHTGAHCSVLKVLKFIKEPS
jgi:hypothetical protein